MLLTTIGFHYRQLNWKVCHYKQKSKMYHFIPTRKIILTFTWTKKHEQKSLDLPHSGKLELCKAAIKLRKTEKQDGSQKVIWWERTQKQAQFFALLSAYIPFHFRPCWLRKVFGTHVFFGGTHACISFFSRIGFLWWASPKGDG